MNIVKITHDKCDQYSKTDYYVVPDGKTADAVSDDVEAAQKAYFKARDDFNAAYPKPVDQQYMMSDGWKKYPDDMTVGDAKRHEAEMQRDEVAGSFQSHLATLGYLTMYAASDQFFQASADWGHHHGQELRF